MQPVVKVLVVVAVVLVVVHITKTWLAPSQEPYRPWIHQQFETVAPQKFAVTPWPLTINANLTAAPSAGRPTVPPLWPTGTPTSAPVMLTTPDLGPVEAVQEPGPISYQFQPILTQVGTSMPAVTPTMVPTFVPTSLPATQRPTMVTAHPLSIAT